MQRLARCAAIATALLLQATPPAPAASPDLSAPMEGMWERRAARLIRNAGHWCDRVRDMRLDKRKSTQIRKTVLVTCSDGRRFAQYELIVDKDNRLRSILPLQAYPG